MKKIISTINPILSKIKYLLLTLTLLFGVVVVGNYILQNLGMSVSLPADMKHNILPVILAAFISMFISQKYVPKRSEILSDK